MKRIQRQLSVWVSRPPRSAPAGAPHGAPRAEGAVALGALAEGGAEDRQRGRGDDRSAEPLNAAGRDQHPASRSQAAGQGSEGKEEQPADEDPAPPEQVGRAAAEEEEAGERQRVGAHDPLELVAAEVELAPDRGQGDVDDRHVEDDHELRGAAQHEGPEVAAVRAHERAQSSCRSNHLTVRVAWTLPE